jgi:secreted PhoX family phosphatase
MNRRELFKSAGIVGATAAAFSCLGARSLLAQDAIDAAATGARGGKRGYGPLVPQRDLATGLALLALPQGFSYRSYGWTGQIMSDGRPTPTAHDGMAVVSRSGRTLSIVRNHENSGSAGVPAVLPGGTYNPSEGGGTSNLKFDLARGQFLGSTTSLAGTIRNCAGGPTPWGSWVTCEETFHTWGDRPDGFNHGYVFDVPGDGISNAKPVRSAGRFSHEAVAFDPSTGVMYETEDTGESGFYKYVQPGAGRSDWNRGRRRTELLRDGGKLHAMVVDGVARKDLTVGFDNGATFRVTWQEVGDPEGQSGAAYDSAPHAAIFARGEGCWYDSGQIYFVSTSGGAAGLGQVWMYDPRRETLTMLYESRASTDVDGPDNLAVSPRGGIILCEDGGSDPKRMIGLTPQGTTFPFAENLIDLAPADVDAIERVYPGVKANFPADLAGVWTSSEWAGATFHGDWLFANIQSPGVTFAITGPWNRGAL